MRSVTVSSGRGSMPRARSRKRRPTLPGRSRLRSASVRAASCADRLHARGSQPSLRARADPGQAPDVERREERRLASWRDDRQPAGLAAVARDLRDHLRGRDADRGAQARRAPDGGLNRLGDGARLAERVRDLAQVEVALVEPRALDRRHHLAHGAPDRGRVLAVDAVARPDENGVRAPAQRLGARHRGPDPELARLVVGGRDDPAPARIAADDQRLRAQLRILELLDGGEERVQIEVPEDHSETVVTAVSLF